MLIDKNTFPYISPNLHNPEIDNLNSPRPIKEMEVVKNLPTHKSNLQAQVASLVNSTRNLRRGITPLGTLFWKLKRRQYLPYL